ncbi:MAG: glycosyltransferase [Ignavibacteriae bacterium]|nr:glycosyltransferase [Ignavibacteriota bacterium]NOG96582.1 glycosyltransferase [Ignavibacteriota bacterium]
MKYSIIIPTLNEEKLLPNLLAQLTDENLRDNFNFEIIVSDGGSSDNTVGIASNLADKVITHEKSSKQNISEGRNAGAEIAEGDILIFLNGDIELENPHKFFESIQTKFVDSKYLAMTCSVVVFPDERKFIDSIFLTFYNYYFHALNVIGLGMGRGECHIVRKNIFWNMNGYNVKLAAGEDYDLFKNIRQEGKILFDQKLFIFESPRRYRKRGHFKILFTWLLNSIFVTLKNKSLSKEWEQIR